MMIVIHHRLTTASKPAAKHAKPSSLKYADTTNRETDKNIYTYLYIPWEKDRGRERRWRRKGSWGGPQNVHEWRWHKEDTRAVEEGQKSEGTKGKNDKETETKQEGKWWVERGGDRGKRSKKCKLLPVLGRQAKWKFFLKGLLVPQKSFSSSASSVSPSSASDQAEGDAGLHVGLSSLLPPLLSNSAPVTTPTPAQGLLVTHGINLTP